MKRLIALILIVAVAAPAYAANELRIDYATGATIVAAVTNDAGQWWDTAGAAFETYNTLTDYDIALSDAGGGCYRGTMPAVDAGVYTIKFYSGTTHIATAYNYYWSGTAVYDPAADAKTAAEAAQTQIGTAVALDGGTATLAGMLTKLADDNGGADYDAGTDSLAVIGPAAADAKTAAEKLDTSTELRTLLTGADTPVAKETSVAAVPAASVTAIFAKSFAALGMTFEDIVETWLFSHDGSHDGGN